jgi:hypothetical protein
MQKHMASSTPDKVSRYFKQHGYIRSSIDDKEFQTWFFWFKKRMIAKHGANTGMIDVEDHVDHSRFERLIVLTYKPILATPPEELAFDSANERMRQIMWNGC